ncbi:MAG: SDR family NAD(P)-dependent oxidoreductase [Hyphomicrobiales bacterium]|nr:SDR family NAD(P)-dependent oxidoreductase [Hyphomicrobiales bacterium]
MDEIVSATATPTSPARLAGRLALVTGASRGYGRAAALAFAKEGAHVIAVARTRGGLTDLDDAIRAHGGEASLITLDLTDAAKVDALGPTLYERFGRLDIFAGVAGVLGVLSPLTHTQTKDWLSVFDVNVHANWRLIRTLDPLLRRSDAGRAIFVTCAAARDLHAYWGPYAASKAAVEALALTYAREVENSCLRVNLIDPGPARTHLRGKAFPGENQASLPDPSIAAPAFIDLACAGCIKNGQIIRL